VGIALVAMGLGVLLGWWLRLSWVVQVVSSSSPMQPMTATAFIVLGGALILLQRGGSRERRAARILLALVALLSAAVLAEYALGVDLGIDRLLGVPYLTAHTAHPGRMAPNTAISFLALAISYLLLAGPRDPRRAAAAASLASVALAVAGTALIGYFTDLERAYGWGAYTRMAVVTAVALGVSAVVALRAARRVARRAAGPGTGWAPWLALVTGLAMTVFSVRAVSHVGLGTLPPEMLQRERSEAWLMLLSGGLVSILWAFAVRRGDALKHHGEALENALGELQRTHQQIERQGAELARAHAVLEAVLTGTQDAVFAKDLEGRYLFLNESAARAMGRPVAELVGRTDEEIVPPETAAAFRASDGAALAAGVVLTSEERRVVDGRQVAYVIAKGVLRDASGQPFGTFGIAHDVSERQAREDSLRSSQEKARRLSVELLRSNQDLERFAYVASHDLQEPLRMVKSYVQLLEKRYGTQLDSTAREFIAFASDGAQRMERMIVDLLAFSRVDRRGARMEPVPLGEPLATALANLRMAIEESGAAIEQGSLPTVDADRPQMAMLFQNLIGNALKFATRGEPPRIAIASRPHDEGCEITVEDNGRGIAPENLERIFDVFVRLEPRRDVPGTGIGLALCRRIAERHGGRIWADSAPGRGSVFHLVLPGPAEAPAGLGEAAATTV
jgi:PAS domain S-box-containing protein